MSFPATVFNVLIASPSDVPKERQAISDCLHAWNALHSKDTGKVLLPVMWESHSAPSMTERAQGVINEQLVRSCDMLIGVFWTRLGSPTGKAKSGTVEEVNWFMRQKKPVMLYFSKAPIDPEKLDTKQFEELKEFKASLMSKGLLEHYTSVEDLEHKLSRQVTIIMREINVTSVVDTKAVKRAIEIEAEGDNEQPTGTDIFLENYTEKSFISVGNTIKWRDELKEIGGSWIKTKRGFSTWCFSKKKLSAVASVIGIPATLREPPNA
ncbi:nucleoside 2-deoxyribosyltransferase [Gluconobacter cerinus]|uniref:DUF4062 domain-containing protein n=1 Tax=Gluconobacter cerinus TaxID=38307 RepID=UPI0022265B85|nr:DUF4062 domain-containing protein [Gluconobacter cerinus]MCW2264273.1 nucleoside 2-deoxyribosyltransferase [Gluconobacter cerinus]